MDSPLSLPDQIAARLSPYLGPNTARNAVRLCARRALDKDGTALAAADLPGLTQALRPMLRTLVGETTTEHLLRDLLSLGKS